MIRNRRKLWTIGTVVIITTVLIMSFIALPQYAVYFYTPSEALAESINLAKTEIKLGGMVEEKSVIWDAEALHLAFTLTDLTGTKITVQYKGTPPDMFKEDSGVVAIGRISPDGKTFVATSLLVKHSEEYRVPHDPINADKSLLEKSLFEGESS